MHARQRNGYRSSSFAIGMSSSRISTEGTTIRKQGFYNGPEQRFNHRGYGRGRGRSRTYHNQLPPPPPPPVQRRTSVNVFMEAGRLATEYLVSKGALPQTVLSSKWQNGNFNKQGQGSDKRKHFDGSRDNLKGKRSKSNHYESDFGKSGSWSDRSKETGGDDDYLSGHREEEQTVVEDIASSVQVSSVSGELMRKHEGAGDSESVLEKFNLQDEAQSKTGSSSGGKEIVVDEISKVSEGSSSLNARSEEMKGNEEHPTAIEEDVSIHEECEADETFVKSGIDLAALCKFEKVPTRTRSSLTAKGPKTHLKEISHKSGLLEEGQSSGKVEDLAVVHRSDSLPNSILRENCEKDLGLELPNLQRSLSVGKVGKKRAGEDSGYLEERAKRQRDWVSLPFSEANEGFNVFKTSETENEENKSSLIDKAEERQLFPASFRTCDLNLGGPSDGNIGKREASQAVEFDLSMSSSSRSLEFSTSTRMSNGKEIEVIDLDDDSPEVVKSSNDPGRKQEVVPFMGIDDVPDYNDGLMMVEFLDSFGNIPPINSGINTAPQNNTVGLQDREILNQVSQQGTLGNQQVENNTDDDLIFMSLGEIPLTFLQAWDQPPTRGYEKPF